MNNKYIILSFIKILSLIIISTLSLTMGWFPNIAVAQKARISTERKPVIAVGKKCFLNSKKIDIHTGPSIKSKKVFLINTQGKKYLTLDNYNIVQIEAIKPGWVKIKTIKPAYCEKKYKGWIQQKYIKYMPTKEEYAAKAKKSRKKISIKTVLKEK